MRSNVLLDPRTQEIIEEIPAPLIKYLIFEGGGVRGLAYSGLVDILFELDMLKDIEHVGGSSIGSIAALVIALGSCPQEIKEILSKLPFKSILEGKDPSLLQFLIAVIIRRNGSLTSGSKLKEWVEDLLEQKFSEIELEKNPNLVITDEMRQAWRHTTFKQLAAKVQDPNNKGRFKYLSVTGSNISKNRLEVFSHETTPDMRIADAILISAAYPGVFKAVEWNGCLYVDGGLMNSNLPTFLFNDRKYLPPNFEFNDKGANPAVLHIKVDTLEEMGLLWNNYKTKLLSTIYEYCIAILYGMQSRDSEIYDQIPTNVVQIFDCDIGTFDLGMTEITKSLLLDAGKEGILEWLYHRYREAYQIKKYQDELAWLATKNVDEIGLIKAYYIAELKRQEEKQSRNDNLITALNEKIVSLTEYISDRAHNVNFPDDPKPLKVTPHINIYCDEPRHDINQKLKCQVESRLLFLQEKILFLENLLKEFKHRIGARIDRVSDGAAYDQVIYVNVLQEELKLFKAVERNLKNIIGQPVAPLPPRADWEPFKKNLEIFLERKTAAWNPHYALMKELNERLYDKILVLKEKKDIVTLDLCNCDDFKLFIMALKLYLRLIDCNSSDTYNTLEETYLNLFGMESLPISSDELASAFNKEGADGYVLMHRMEFLLKYFASIDRPKDKLKFDLINLDDVFAKLNSQAKLESIFKKYQERDADKQANEIEMTFMYKPFSHTERFLMFHSNSGLQNRASCTHVDTVHAVTNRCGLT